MSKQAIQNLAWQDAEEEWQPSATDDIRGRGWGSLICGLFMLPTPIWWVGVACICIGVAFLATTPLLQRTEDDAQAEWQAEQAQGRSGCGAMAWGCIVGAMLLTLATLVAGAISVTIVGR